MQLKPLISGILYTFILVSGFSPILLLAEENRAQMHANTKDYTLANGLRVILREDHRSPMISMQIWYNVGSAFEPYGQTGISHMLEHMMFRGSKNFPDGVYRRTVSEVGGSQNAFTADDFTAYTLDMPAPFLEQALAMEADRMNNLVLNEADFLKEREVVKEERKLRVDDQPTARLYELFQNMAYTKSQYRNPTIGWEADISAYTVEKLENWYRSWYAPSNATLVLVGAFDQESAQSMIAQYFAAIPQRAVPPHPDLSDEHYQGRTLITLTDKKAVPTLIMGFPVPNLDTVADKRDVYAIEVLQYILDGSLGAYFEKHLVRAQQLAQRIGSSYDPFARGAQLFTVVGVLRNQVTHSQLEEAIFSEFHNMFTAKITAEDIDRACKHIHSRIIYGQDTPHNAAMQLGALASNGHTLDAWEQYVQGMRAVQVEDIHRVVQQYFHRNNVRVGYLFESKDVK